VLGPDAVEHAADAVEVSLPRGKLRVTFEAVAGGGGGGGARRTVRVKSIAADSPALSLLEIGDEVVSFNGRSLGVDLLEDGGFVKQLVAASDAQRVLVVRRSRERSAGRGKEGARLAAETADVSGLPSCRAVPAEAAAAPPRPATALAAAEARPFRDCQSIEAFQNLSPADQQAFGGMMLGIFDDLDVNGDGVISRETLAAYLGEVAAVPRSPPRAGARSQPAAAAAGGGGGQGSPLAQGAVVTRKAWRYSRDGPFLVHSKSPQPGPRAFPSLVD